MKTFLLIGLCCLGALAFLPQRMMACSRAVYLGPDGMIATGRTMDWAEDLHTNLRLFPRGIARRGAKQRQYRILDFAIWFDRCNGLRYRRVRRNERSRLGC